MLLPPDIEIARRDSAIPGLGLLLDPEAFSIALGAAFPEANITTVRARYVRYKPGTNCLIAYRLQSDGMEIDVYAKAFRVDAFSKLRKMGEQFKAHTPLGTGGAILDDVLIAVFPFPNDYKLSTMASLVNNKTRRRLFTTVFPDQPEWWDAKLRTLRYKPERRYVAQIITREGKLALLKVYTESNYAAANRGSIAFVSQEPLRVAQQLGHFDNHCALVLEWLPGYSLTESAVSRFALDKVRAVGEALACVHAQNPKGLGFISREMEVKALSAAANAVTAVYPLLADKAHNLATHVAERLKSIPFDARPIHGDFDTDQVLVSEEGVAILDFDEAALGDPVVDLGFFAARLEWAALRGDLSMSQAKALTENLLEGYCFKAGCDLPAHFSLYKAVGLLRIAPHPFRNRFSDWLEQTQAIFDQIGVIMEKDV